MGTPLSVVTTITAVLESEPLAWGHSLAVVASALLPRNAHSPPLGSGRQWVEAVGTERSPLSRGWHLARASPAREVTGVSRTGCPAPGAPGRAETQARLDESEAAVQLRAPGRGTPARVPQRH